MSLVDTVAATQLQRRAQANAPAARCPRRRQVPRLDLRARGAGGGVCNAPMYSLCAVQYLPWFSNG